MRLIETSTAVFVFFFWQITCDSESQRGYVFCGFSRPSRIVFSCSKIKIAFKSDSNAVYAGFIIAINIRSMLGKISRLTRSEAAQSFRVERRSVSSPSTSRCKSTVEDAKGFKQLLLQHEISEGTEQWSSIEPSLYHHIELNGCSK